MIDTQHEAAVIWSLDFDAELPCESEHFQIGNTICSGKGVVIAEFSCHKSVIGCKNYSKFFAKEFTMDGACMGCNKGIPECWQIRPI